MTAIATTRSDKSVGFHLGRTTRRVVLVAHIVSAGAWIGIDIVVAVLVAVGWFGSEAVRGLAYQTLGTFVVWPMLLSGVVSLVSGLVLGLGTKFGLVKYWWVFVKLVMNVALCVTIVAVLRPGMVDVAEHGRMLSAAGSSSVDVSFLFFPPIVSLTALTFATALSVFKPWGRIQGKRPDRDATESRPAVGSVAT